jgi:ADP-ribose pyrophosphatase
MHEQSLGQHVAADRQMDRNLPTVYATVSTTGSWEVPAGGMQPGLGREETALAKLREEIGGRAQSIEYFGQFYTANGICNEVAHVYIAAGVSLGETEHEAAEVIEVHPLPLEDVLAMAHANQISDGPTALALLLAESRLREIVNSAPI